MEEVLLIHHYGGYGGAGVSFIDIVDSLIDDYRLTVICPSNPSTMFNELKKRPITILTIPNIGILPYYNGGSKRIISFHSLRNIYKVIQTYKQIEMIISKFVGDIVIVNSMTLSWIGPIVKKYNKKGICFHRETYIDKSLGTKLIKNLMKNYFLKSIFISKFDYDETPEIPTQRKSVIYDKVRKDLFYNKDFSKIKDNQKILYLGGFSSLKGADLLVKALNHLESKNAKVIFVGSSNGNNYELEIMKYVSNNNLNDKIEFRDLTTHPEKLYKESNIVVFPSTYPHQSRPIYEAGLAGIPIIISGFENTNEFIKDGITGFTFEPNNYLDLSRTIDKVFKLDEEKIKKVIINNQRQALNRNDFSNLREELLDIMENM